MYACKCTHIFIIHKKFLLLTTYIILKITYSTLLENEKKIVKIVIRIITLDINTKIGQKTNLILVNKNNEIISLQKDFYQSRSNR